MTLSRDLGACGQSRRPRRPSTAAVNRALVGCPRGDDGRERQERWPVRRRCSTSKAESTIRPLKLSPRRAVSTKTGPTTTVAPPSRSPRNLLACSGALSTSPAIGGGTGALTLDGPRNHIRSLDGMRGKGRHSASHAAHLCRSRGRDIPPARRRSRNGVGDTPRLAEPRQAFDPDARPGGPLWTPANDVDHERRARRHPRDA